MWQRMEYPRPQFQRKDWLSLNGEWEFAFDDENEGLKKGYDTGLVSLPLKINVPFVYQYEASGIGDTACHARVWYRRVFEPQREGRALLNFNGSDHITDVWVNGKHVCTHVGGYTPFSADITDYLTSGQNVIVVRCLDTLDKAIPRGKQSWTGERFGCWYIPSTGIWQSVWIDYFGGDCIKDYYLNPDYDSCSVLGELTTLRGMAQEAEIEITFGGRPIAKSRFAVERGRISFCIPLFDCAVRADYAWSPARPALFQAALRLFQDGNCVDEAVTRFGLRKISAEGGKIYLNGEPLYQRLILDQGYWRESGLTPPSAEALKQDIELARAMGFNGARKHQKFEDPYFYYYAEELGYLVWCEMPSAYDFCADEIENLSAQWLGIVRAARGFTSIVCYVPLNESWGVEQIADGGAQLEFARAIYCATKALDKSRLVSTNDGWESPDTTDILGIHDYAFDSSAFGELYRAEKYDTVAPQSRRLFAKGCKYGGQPALLTEFGGIAKKSETVSGNWGYNDGAADDNEFYSRYQNLVDGIYANEALQGFCYTQLTDVQQEVNGLLDADHRPKFDVKVIQQITEHKK